MDNIQLSAHQSIDEFHNNTQWTLCNRKWHSSGDWRARTFIKRPNAAARTPSCHIFVHLVCGEYIICRVHHHHHRTRADCGRIGNASTKSILESHKHTRTMYANPVFVFVCVCLSICVCALQQLSVWYWINLIYVPSLLPMPALDVEHYTSTPIFWPSCLPTVCACVPFTSDAISYTGNLFGCLRMFMCVLCADHSMPKICNVNCINKHSAYALTYTDSLHSRGDIVNDNNIMCRDLPRLACGRRMAHETYAIAHAHMYTIGIHMIWYYNMLLSCPAWCQVRARFLSSMSRWINPQCVLHFPFSLSLSPAMLVFAWHHGLVQWRLLGDDKLARKKIFVVIGHVSHPLRHWIWRANARKSNISIYHTSHIVIHDGCRLGQWFCAVNYNSFSHSLCITYRTHNNT